MYRYSGVRALPVLLVLLCLGQLLGAGDLGLDADAAEDEGDAEPLHRRQVVAEGNDGEDHGDHLAGDGDGDKEDGGEGGEGVDWGCVKKVSIGLGRGLSLGMTGRTDR